MDIFMHSGRYIRFSENMHFLIKFCINLHVSELIFVPVTTVHMFQLYKYNISI